MRLMVLGSSSDGNCYLLEGKSETLILEAGVHMSEIKKALSWNLLKVRGCLVSHRHNDHAKSVKGLIDCGIKVYALQDVLEHKRVGESPFSCPIKPLDRFCIGGFKVLPFDVCHDVPCLGFVISHEEMGKMLFITDTMMTEYRFKGINHFMVEANYSDELLNDSIMRGIVPESMRERLHHSHMELGTTIGVLRANNLDDTSNIILIHLSGNNSDAERFKSAVESACGLPVEVAVPGMEKDLSKEVY